MVDPKTARPDKKAPVGGPGTNQFQIKGTPKAVPTTPSAAASVQITEELRSGLKHLIRDEAEYEADQEEIPSLGRAFTDGKAFEDLIRTGVAYGVMWALGKLLLELFGGDGDD